MKSDEIKDKKKKVEILMGMAAERMFSTERFNKELRTQHNIAREIFLGDPMEETLPKLIIITRTRNKKEKVTYGVIVCALANFNEDNKYKMLEGLGAKIAENGIKYPMAVFQQSEAWVSNGGSGVSQEDIDSGNFIRPKDDPNHSEILMTAGMTIDGRCNMASSLIMNVKGKKARFLAEATYGDFDKTKSKDSGFDSPLLKRFWIGYSKYMVLKEGGLN